MIIQTFIVFFIIFLVIFSGPKFRKREKSQLFKLFTIPAFLACIMVLLTMIKVYFIYKLLILIFILVMVLLSYWQWGERISRWWK